MQMGAASPVGSPAIGALQPGQGNDVIQELTSLVEAGMDVACFDLSQGALEHHLDLADSLAEVTVPSQQPKALHSLLYDLLCDIGNLALLLAVDGASTSIT